MWFVSAEPGSVGTAAVTMGSAAGAGQVHVEGLLLQLLGLEMTPGDL